MLNCNQILERRKGMLHSTQHPPQCGQQDLNLHGLPLEPKSSASANSAMTADTGKSTTKTSSAQLHRFPDQSSQAKNNTRSKKCCGYLQDETSGTRTPDNLIKSQVLYRLS